VIEWHKGEFGSIDLQQIYPFLNAAGVLFLAATDISMWFWVKRNERSLTRIH
jgi:HAMP domain-containing protein